MGLRASCGFLCSMPPKPLKYHRFRLESPWIVGGFAVSPQKDSRPGSAGTGIRAAALLLALAVAAQGCGYVGIAGLVYKIASDREEKDEHAPAIASASPIGISQGQLVTIRYSIVDPESDPCDVTPGYSLDGGLTFSAPSELPASLSEGTAELSSSPRGHDHVFVWNAPADVQGYNRTVIFRLTPRERRTSAAGPDWNSAPFVLFANSAPAASVETPAGNPGGRVEIAYTLSDGESNPANVAAAFSIDGGTTWNVPTRFAGLGSEGVSSLTTSQAGIRHVFRWESYPDMGAGDFQVVFRVTPTDSVSGAAGIPAVSPQFTAGNSRARTVAGGAASTMGNPVSCASDSRGVIYFAENPGHRIWAYNPTSSTLLVCGRSLNPRETAAVAGDGSAGFGPDSVPGPESPLDTPLGIAADNATPPAVYFADSQNHRIRRIDASTGFVTTVCGNGAAGTADACPAILGSLDSPEAVACDSTGNLFIADTGNNAIRFINRGFIDKPVAGVTVKPGWIGTVAGQTGAPDGFSGDGGASTAALLDSPAAIVVDQIGNFFFCDSGNSRIRGVAAGSGVLPFGSVAIAAGCIGTVAGGGTYTPGLTERGPRTVQLGAPSGLVLTQSGGMYFPDSSGHAICFVNGSNTVSANTGATTVSPDRLVTVAGTWNVPGSSGDGGSAFQALLQDPSHVCTATGGMLAFVDEGNGRIRVLNTSPPGGPDSTFGSVSLSSAEIGTGLLPDSPGIGAPSGLDSSGASVFFTSASGNRIFRFDSSSGAVAAVAGSGAAGSADGLPGQASFLSPADVAVNYTGVVLLVADSGNSAIRIVNFGGDTSIYGENISAGEVATVTAAAGQLLSPQGLETHEDGRSLRGGHGPPQDCEGVLGRGHGDAGRGRRHPGISERPGPFREVLLPLRRGGGFVGTHTRRRRHGKQRDTAREPVDLDRRNRLRHEDNRSPGQHGNHRRHGLGGIRRRRDSGMDSAVQLAFKGGPRRVPERVCLRFREQQNQENQLLLRPCVDSARRRSRGLQRRRPSRLRHVA